MLSVFFAFQDLLDEEKGIKRASWVRKMLIIHLRDAPLYQNGWLLEILQKAFDIFDLGQI